MSESEIRREERDCCGQISLETLETINELTQDLRCKERKGEKEVKGG
jgi:hypothetical protein